MKTIAKTKDGFLLEATEDEVKDMMKTLGISKPTPEVGIKIPVGDYNSTLVKLRSLRDSYAYEKMREYVDQISKSIQNLDNTFEAIQETEEK